MDSAHSPKALAYSIPEVCEETGLGRSTIYEEIREGRLRARKCGRRTIVLPDDLTAWLNSLPQAGEAA